MAAPFVFAACSNLSGCEKNLLHQHSVICASFLRESIAMPGNVAQNSASSELNFSDC